MTMTRMALTNTITTQNKEQRVRETEHSVGTGNGKMAVSKEEKIAEFARPDVIRQSDSEERQPLT